MYMSYTGYTEGTFSSQIGNYKNRVMSLEKQVITLTENISLRDEKIKQLQILLQKYENNANVNEQQDCSAVTENSTAVKTKTKQTK